MLTVVIEARSQAERLPALLAQLTAGAVDGLVRQVLIVAAPGQAMIAELCEETGAEPVASLPLAAQAARSDRLLVLPADFRLRDGWIAALEAHMAAGGAQAAVVGLGEGGLLGRRPRGLLVERGLVQDGVDDAQRLRRRLGLLPARVG
jgi:hypothetical protein